MRVTVFDGANSIGGSKIHLFTDVKWWQESGADSGFEVLI